MRFGDLASLHLNTYVNQKILRETKIKCFLKLDCYQKQTFLWVTYSERSVQSSYFRLCKVLDLSWLGGGIYILKLYSTWGSRIFLNLFSFLVFWGVSGRIIIIIQTWWTHARVFLDMSESINVSFGGVFSNIWSQLTRTINISKGHLDDISIFVDLSDNHGDLTAWNMF